ncbi:MAG: 30S ribosomal protein S8 [Candidatus Pacebacteria bacterium]|nr:30S ribosomal protein S8 [Candidatus Paceibacterota bacterium]
MTDPITDMFNRIRNAQIVFHKTTEIPFSKLRYSIAEILKAEGFILDCKKKGKKPYQFVKVQLKYDNKIPAVSGFKRISKPGQRIYKRANEISKVKSGYGLAIVSTTKGLLTDKEARKNKIGGELMVEVW